MKTSYSMNYGTYLTSGLFNETKQFSAYIEVNKELKNKLNIGVAGAFDIGDLFYNSGGIMFNIFKSF